MSHDRLFKKLISLYFYDFLELFAPTLWERIDRSRSPSTPFVFSPPEPENSGRRNTSSSAMTSLP